MLDDNRAYLRELFYETGKYISEHSDSSGTDALAEKIILAGAAKGPIYCDNSQPRTIEDLRSRGINAMPCIKGQGSLGAGIMHLQGLDISLTADSTNGWMEKKKYQYPVGADNKPMPGADPIKKHDHFMDAARYGLYSYATLGGIAIYKSEKDYY